MQKSECHLIMVVPKISHLSRVMPKATYFRNIQE